MNTLSTHTKVRTAYGCNGKIFHVIAGIALLKNGKGYECPYCHGEVYDISDTAVGRSYLELTRTDLHSPPPLREVE